MLSIAICDDDSRFTGEMETMLLTISEKEHITMEVDVFWKSQELVNNIVEGRKTYDLLFMDIEIEMDGISAAREIRKKDNNVLLIYTTSHTSYALEAYEVHPFQFMVKPIDYKTLRQYFLAAYNKIDSEPAYYLFQYDRQTYRVPIRDIMYFASKRRVTYIFMRDGTAYKHYQQLNDIEMRMKKGKQRFWRIHQSHLVNANCIYRVSHDSVALKNGEILSISSNRRKLIAELYCDSIGEDIIDKNIH